MMNNEKVAALILEVTTIAYQVMEGATVTEDHPYAWLGDFDRDELKNFVESVTSTFHQFAGQPSAWDEVDAVVFEWHESALINASGVLDEMYAKDD